MLLYKSNSLIILTTASLLILLINSLIVQASSKGNNKKEVSRKSIVFDIKTPKVFYCPQEKQSDYTKTIVKAKPLEKLCEFEGKLKPKNSPSDCYNDVDETEFACDEKKRFLLRLDPPADSVADAAQQQANDDQVDEFDYFSKQQQQQQQLKKKKSGKKL